MSAAERNLKIYVRVSDSAVSREVYVSCCDVDVIAMRITSSRRKSKEVWCWLGILLAR